MVATALVSFTLRSLIAMLTGLQYVLRVSFSSVLSAKAGGWRRREANGNSEKEVGGEEGGTDTCSMHRKGLIPSHITYNLP